MFMTSESTLRRGARKVMFGAGLALLIAAPAWPCQIAGNLVSECGFPDITPIPPWVVEVGLNCAQSSSASNSPGSLQCDSFDSTVNNQVRISQCLPAGTDAVYGYGADGSLVANNTPPTCTVEISDWSGPTCNTGNVNSASTPLVPLTAPNYSQSTAASYDTDATTDSVQILIRCLAPTGAGEAFTIRFDDVFVGVGLVPVELQEFSVD